MIPRARWHQIRSVFEQVADMDGPERSVQLDKCCGEDSDLRLSVQSLLARDSSKEDPLLHAVARASA